MSTFNHSNDPVQIHAARRSFRDGPTERVILDGVDLSIAPGEMVAVMGPSGSGKTTLLQMVAGLDRPDSGQVIVNGTHLSACDLGQLAQMRREVIGYVEQRLNLIGVLTAIENVMLPLELGGIKPRKARPTAMAALDSVGLADHADLASERLSGGEQQRVAIARALVGTRSVVLADEPTAALDSLTGESVMKLLRRRCDDAGASVLVATHDAGHAAWADRVVFLRDGVILDQASPPPSPAVVESVDPREQEARR